jgi:hypothetical protein
MNLFICKVGRTGEVNRTCGGLPLASPHQTRATSYNEIVLRNLGNKVRYVPVNTVKRHSLETRLHYEEWRLLGCYAVWLL